MLEKLIKWREQNLSRVPFYDRTLLRKYLEVLGVASTIVALLAFVGISQGYAVNFMGLTFLFFILLGAIFFYMWWSANRIQCVNLKINNTKVHIAEGDIWSLYEKEPEDRKGEITVITVNDFFDTIVDDRIIASQSLHGQYMTKITKAGKLSKLNRTIETNEILNKPENHEDVPQRKAGKKVRYPIGSLVEFESHVLAVFSKFDENNKSVITTQEYTDFWMKFWQNIDNVYAGRTINIPLIGAGIARFRSGKPSKQELLETILWTLKISGFHNTYSDKQINIVIYPSDVDEIDFYGTQNSLKFK